MIEFSGLTFMAFRSEFRECPTRIASGGRIFLRCSWTSDSLVVTSLSILLVMPENRVK